MMPAADSAAGPAVSGWSDAPPDTDPGRRHGQPAGHGVPDHGIHNRSEGTQPVFMVAEVPSGSRDPVVHYLRPGCPARILP